MTKLKIAAVVVCMIATGAFAGFTYQAVSNGSADEDVTVRSFTEVTTDDEDTTDDETTSDETVTDDETASKEVTAEEDTLAVTTAVTAKKTEKVTKKKAEKSEAKNTLKKTTIKISDEDLKKAAPAPAVTAAPVVEEVPVTEAYTEAPVYEEPVYTESEPVYEEPAEETAEVTEVAPVEETAPAEEPAPEEQQDNGRKVQVTDEEYIWLCNVVGHEYGSDWIAIEEKAKVVEAVMNRVKDPRFPNSIWGVLTQPYQFSGLEWTLYLGTFSYQVTPSVKAAVDLYLEHPEQFNHGYNSFWGDGSMNHFYSI